MIKNGFTLVETLVSIVAGGLLLGAISFVIAGLGDNLRENERPRAVNSQQAERILTNALVSARFADARFAPLPRAENGLHFRMIAPAALQRVGYIDAVLEASANGDTQSLILRSAANAFPQVEILSGQQDIRFAYAEVLESNREFVREIVIFHRGKDDADYRQIIIRPKINGRGACVFDLVSQRCRS